MKKPSDSNGFPLFIVVIIFHFVIFQKSERKKRKKQEHRKGFFVGFQGRSLGLELAHELLGQVLLGLALLERTDGAEVVDNIL